MTYVKPGLTRLSLAIASACCSGTGAGGSCAPPIPNSEAADCVLIVGGFGFGCV